MRMCWWQGTASLQLIQLAWHVINFENNLLAWLCIRSEANIDWKFHTHCAQTRQLQRATPHYNVICLETKNANVLTQGTANLQLIQLAWRVINFENNLLAWLCICSEANIDWKFHTHCAQTRQLQRATLHYDVICLETKNANLLMQGTVSLQLIQLAWRVINFENNLLAWLCIRSDANIDWQFHTHCAQTRHASASTHFYRLTADSLGRAAHYANQGCSYAPKLAVQLAHLNRLRMLHSVLGLPRCKCIPGFRLRSFSVQRWVLIFFRMSFVTKKFFIWSLTSVCFGNHYIFLRNFRENQRILSNYFRKILRLFQEH